MISAEELRSLQGQDSTKETILIDIEKLLIQAAEDGKKSIILDHLVSSEIEEYLATLGYTILKYATSIGIIKTEIYW